MSQLLLAQLVLLCLFPFISLNYWWKITECSNQINQISWACSLTGNPTLLSVLILPGPNKKLDCFKTFFFLNLASPAVTSGRVVSPFQAPVPATEPRGRLQLHSRAPVSEIITVAALTGKKRRSIRVERPELLPTTDATDVYRLMGTVSWSSALKTRKWPLSYVRPCAVNVHRFPFTDVAAKPRIGIGRLCPDYRKLNTTLGSSCAERPVGQV